MIQLKQLLDDKTIKLEDLSYDEEKVNEIRLLLTRKHPTRRRLTKKQKKNNTEVFTSYFTPLFACIIWNTDKRVVIVNFFDHNIKTIENYYSIKIFCCVVESMGFKLEVTPLDFGVISDKQKVIQTLKFLVTSGIISELPLKVRKKITPAQAMEKYMNSDRAIDLTEAWYKHYKILESNPSSPTVCKPDWF